MCVAKDVYISTINRDVFQLLIGPIRCLCSGNSPRAQIAQFEGQGMMHMVHVINNIINRYSKLERKETGAVEGGALARARQAESR